MVWDTIKQLRKITNIMFDKSNKFKVFDEVINEFV